MTTFATIAGTGAVSGRGAAKSRGNTMKRLTVTFLSAACAVMPAGLLPSTTAHAQSVAKPNSTVEISIGRGKLVTVPSTMSDVFVANESIADVQVKSTRQLYVFGKSGGETTVYASNASGDVVWSANIRVGSNIESVDQMLALAMPDAKISVATMSNNTVLLTGTVAAPEDAAEAERLVAAYMGEGTNVISRLRMATPLQVNLQVRIAEVSRSLVRQLGFNLNSIDATGGFKFGIGRGRALAPGQTWSPSGPIAVGQGAGQVSSVFPDGTEVTGPAISPLEGQSTIAGMGRLLGLNLLGALDAGETMGLVTTLSQPNLTALSGETADFLAGGEFPIPINGGLTGNGIEYKKYGVSLAYTPTVLANGRISIRVRPEVSELSSQGAVVIGSVQVPALTVRRAETTVELGSGQSFMIAGLLSSNAQNTMDKTPLAGDLPVLGALFRSKDFRKGQTELVIVVTPYLVKPVNDGDIKLPTDGFRAATEFEQTIGNMDSKGISGGSRPGPTTAPAQAPVATPKVGAADDAGLTSDGKPRKKGKAERRAEAAAAPGFSFK